MGSGQAQGYVRVLGNKAVFEERQLFYRRKQVIHRKYYEENPLIHRKYYKEKQVIHREYYKEEN